MKVSNTVDQRARNVIAGAEVRYLVVSDLPPLLSLLFIFWFDWPLAIAPSSS